MLDGGMGSEGGDWARDGGYTWCTRVCMDGDGRG